MIRSSIPGRLFVVGFGLWAGILLGIGLLALPSAFAVLERHQAGLLANRLFTVEAYASLLAAVVSLIGLLVLRRRQTTRIGRPSAGLSPRALMVVLIVVAAFTVLGHFAITPLMAQARAGAGSWSFGTLHALSSAMYAIKTLTLLALFWYVS